MNALTQVAAPARAAATRLAVVSPYKMNESAAPAPADAVALSGGASDVAAAPSTSAATVQSPAARAVTVGLLGLAAFGAVMAMPGNAYADQHRGNFSHSQTVNRGGGQASRGGGQVNRGGGQVNRGGGQVNQGGGHRQQQPQQGPRQQGHQQGGQQHVPRQQGGQQHVPGQQWPNQQGQQHVPRQQWPNQQGQQHVPRQQGGQHHGQQHVPQQWPNQHGQHIPQQWPNQHGGQHHRPPTWNQQPMQHVRSGHNRYDVPRGGWVTGAHNHHPGIRTVVIHDRPIYNRPVVVRNFFNDCYGSDWGYGHHHHNPYGFYHGSNFWLGFEIGQMLSWNLHQHPVYVYSPISQHQVGVLQPPVGGTFQSERDVHLAVLTAMSQPTAEDPTGGIYSAQGYDGEAVGPRASVAYAYNSLRQGNPIYFHPSNGAYEKIESLDDLQTYVYTREARTDAPSQVYDQQ